MTPRAEATTNLALSLHSPPPSAGRSPKGAIADGTLCECKARKSVPQAVSNARDRASSLPRSETRANLAPLGHTALSPQGFSRAKNAEESW